MRWQDDLKVAGRMLLEHSLNSPWLVATVLIFVVCVAANWAEPFLRSHGTLGALVANELAPVALIAWNPFAALSVDGFFLLLGVWLILALAASFIVSRREQLEQLITQHFFRQDLLQVLFKHFVLPELERSSFLLICACAFSILFDALLVTVPPAASRLESFRSGLFIFAGLLVFHGLYSGVVFDARVPWIRRTGLLVWWFVNGVTRYYAALEDRPEITVLGLAVSSILHLPIVLLIGGLSTMPVTWVASWAARKWPGGNLFMVCRIGSQMLAIAVCSLWAAQSAALTAHYLAATAYKLSTVSLWMGTLLLTCVVGYFCAAYGQVLMGYYHNSAILTVQWQGISGFHYDTEGPIREVIDRFWHKNTGDATLNPTAPNQPHHPHRPRNAALGAAAAAAPALDALRVFNSLSGLTEATAKMTGQLHFSNDNKEVHRELLLEKATFELILVFRSNSRRLWESSREEMVLATIQLEEEIKVPAGAAAVDVPLKASVAVKLDAAKQLLKAAQASLQSSLAGLSMLSLWLGSGSDLTIEDIKLDLVMQRSGALPLHRMPLLGAQARDGAGGAATQWSAEQLRDIQRMVQDYSERLALRPQSDKYSSITTRVKGLLTCPDDQVAQQMMSVLFEICNLAENIDNDEEGEFTQLLINTVSLIQQLFFKRIIGRVVHQRSRATLVTDLACVVLFVASHAYLNFVLAPPNLVQVIVASAFKFEDRAAAMAIADGGSVTLFTDPDANPPTAGEADGQPADSPAASVPPLAPPPIPVPLADSMHYTNAVAGQAFERERLAEAEAKCQVEGIPFTYPQDLVESWTAAKKEAIEFLRSMVKRIKVTRQPVAAYVGHMNFPSSGHWDSEFLKAQVRTWEGADFSQFDEHRFDELLANVAGAPTTPQQALAAALLNRGPLRHAEQKVPDDSDPQTPVPEEEKADPMMVEMRNRNRERIAKFYADHRDEIMKLFDSIATEQFADFDDMDKGVVNPEAVVARVLECSSLWESEVQRLKLGTEDEWIPNLQHVLSEDDVDEVKVAAPRYKFVRQFFVQNTRVTAQRGSIQSMSATLLLTTLGSPRAAPDSMKQFVQRIVIIEKAIATECTGLFPALFDKSETKEGLPNVSMLDICTMFLPSTIAEDVTRSQRDSMWGDFATAFFSLQTILPKRFKAISDEFARTNNVDRARKPLSLLVSFAAEFAASKPVFNESAAKNGWANSAQMEAAFAEINTVRTQADALLSQLPTTTTTTIPLSSPAATLRQRPPASGQ